MGVFSDTWQLKAFNEGFAQTNECQYFWDAGIGSWGIGQGCYKTGPLLWNANDEHNRGGLLTYALLESRGFFVYASPYMDYNLPPIISHWRATSNLWFSGSDQQLGRFLSYLAGKIRSGNAGVFVSSVEKQENLISRLLYRFQYRGIPVGSQVTKTPPTARMIGVDGAFGYSSCYNNFSFTTVGSPQDSSGPLSHTLVFWIGDPLSSFAIPCPVVLTKTPSLLSEDVSWLGSAEFTSSEVASALQACRSTAGSPRTIDIFVEGMLTRGGQKVFSVRDLGVLYRLPQIHVVYQPLIGSCEETGGGGGGGCTLRSLSSADLPPGFFVGVGLWGVLFFLLWRVLRRV
jgi:hypothetical protein